MSKKRSFTRKNGVAPETPEEELPPSSSETTTTTTTSPQGDDDDEEAEVWDLVRDLRSDSKKPTCMTDGCDESAVATWSSNVESEPWHSCESCQEKDFGGWPVDSSTAAASSPLEGADATSDDATAKGDDATTPSTAEVDDETPPNDSAADDGDGTNVSENQDDKNVANACACEGARANDNCVNDADPSSDSEQTLPRSNKSKKRRIDDEDGEDGAVDKDDTVDKEGDDPATNDEMEAKRDEKATKKMDSDDEASAAKESEKTTDNCDEGTNDDDEAAEEWDLKIVFSAKDIDKANPIICSTDNCPLVACSVWSSSNEPDQPWYSCIDCQEVDFEGWPTEQKDVPIKILSAEHKRIMAEKCSRQDSPGMPNLPEMVLSTSSNNVSLYENTKANGTAEGEENAPMENDDGDDNAEVWDLKMVFSSAEICKTKPMICSTDNCTLVACSVWLSNTAPDEPWYTCIDCQETDFDGWPTEKKELPLKAMSAEHKNIIAEKCSRQDSPAMPDLPETASPTKTGAASKSSSNSIVTPPPGHLGTAKQKKAAAPGKARAGVTPSPMPPPKAKQPSATALAMHRKWQAEAEKMGGEGARIVVAKPAAKKLIFDMLHESFRPMNITEIYKALKAVVPSPVLKSCLDDMLGRAAQDNPFDESDDEDDGKSSSSKKKKASEASASSGGDQFAGSLCIKEGRNTNNTLYFVDQTKLNNNGDGLLPDERNTLAADLEQSKAEEAVLNKNLKQITSEATKLLSEPTNEDADAKLASEEKHMEDLREKLEGARELKVNEKHTKQTKKRIQSLENQWRKRRRLTLDFLVLMEESTDGSFSTKKCMAGDGPIEIDSDEAVIQGAKTYAKKKKARAAMGGRVKTLKKGGSSVSFPKVGGGKSLSGVPPDESFIGVRLNARGMVERVYLDEEE